MITGISYAEAYPLVRGGGLFLAIVGAGILVGGAVPRARGAALAVSAFVAAVLTTLLARQLAAPFGVPTALQVWSLAGAVALEGLLIPLVVRRFRPQGLRAVTLAVMLVVGVHFLPMALAFGPALVILALLVCLLSISGFLLPRVPLDVLWGFDGLAKLTVGAVMWATGVQW